MKSISLVGWTAWTWAQPVDDVRYLAGPQVRFLCLSYAQNLAIRDSRKARLLIQSPKYQRYWGDRVILSGDQNAKARFENTEKGYRLASSVEGMATGEGGDIDIVDDPMNAANKESEVERQNVVDWWTQVMPTRLNDPVRGAFVIVMQRLHHQDITGHILASETGWTHLCLPARYESDHPHVYARDKRRRDGELLWRARFDDKALRQIEETLGSYGTAGQLQQRPAPREGGMFNRAWFQRIAAAPSKTKWCRGWDLAGTDKKKSPWTAGVLLGRFGGDYFVMHVARDKGTPKHVEKMLVACAAEDGKRTTIDFPQDPGQAGKHQRTYLTQLLSGYNVRSSPETGSKITRAEPYSAQAEGGNVYIVTGDDGADPPWVRDYLDELEMFPNSDFSDQVDGSSRAFARLTRRRSSAAGGAVLIE